MKKVSFFSAFSAICDALRGKMRGISTDVACRVSSMTTPFKFVKKRMGLLMCGLFFITTMTTQAQTQIPGTNLTWSFSSGTLTIGGTGHLYLSGSAPWNSHIASINTVVIGSGVSSIDGNMFTGCTNLNEVTIYGYLLNIGNNAFAENNNLRSVTIGNGVRSIGNSAFENLPNLTNVIFTDQSNLSSINQRAFLNCSA